MPELAQTKRTRRGLKITLICVLALIAAIGGVNGVTTKSWLASSTSTPAPDSAEKTPEPASGPGSTLLPGVVEPASMVLVPEANATAVNPGAPVVAQVTNGTVHHAVLKESATGASLAGELFVSGRKWINSEPLKFNTDYIFHVTALDLAGTKTISIHHFTTVPTTHEANLALYPFADSVVGVAQPIQFTFSEPVLNKAAVEKAITVTTATGQSGAFRWYSDTMVRYRAAEYWPANSKVTVQMNLFGIDFGNGQIGNFNRTDTVNIGNKSVMEVDVRTKQVQIFVNDSLARTFPATLGDSAFPSPSGTMVIMNDKQRFATFRASTIGLNPGDPGDYGSVDVEFATRLTNSGVFIHQATPSAMPYLGVLNLSHGCVGLSAEGASWVFNNMLPGDLINTVGTPNETIAPTDGFGDWNIPFAQYASR